MDIWAKYVAEIRVMAGGPTQDQMAEKTGVPQGTISRWLDAKNPSRDPANVAQFAKGYERNVLEAFVAAGLLEVEDARAGMDDDSVAFLERVKRGRKLNVKPRRSTVTNSGR